ncbi:hypothetical protein QJS04_geneDACA005095 [Acorus gramineus]|uniref:Uncharacterized protein n=1 Tax=Acorus gramineus TaxID=55184 RepID=A0AAV9AY91_ACOGR|nr:hypothetical protein QJS04_geneDACA005095 [Acorus gramineus]
MMFSFQERLQSTTMKSGWIWAGEDCGSPGCRGGRLHRYQIGRHSPIIKDLLLNIASSKDVIMFNASLYIS